MQISALNVYPVKSCRGTTLAKVTVAATGLKADRRFMIVNEDGNFVTQRQLPQLALIDVKFDGQLLILGAGDLTFEATEQDLTRAGHKRMVKVWDDAVEANDCGEAAAAFLASAMQTLAPQASSMRLVMIQEHKPRLVTSKYAEGGRHPYWFADGFPFLVVTESSLQDLNQRLEAQGKAALPMNRFRPNIVLQGAEPFAEDKHRGIKIGENVIMHFMKPCARCKITMTDQATAKLAAEPLQTLGTYRKNDQGKILFGQNAVLIQGAGREIAVGDEVTWV